jgi:hypothetical protein
MLLLGSDEKEKITGEVKQTCNNYKRSGIVENWLRVIQA